MDKQIYLSTTVQGAVISFLSVIVLVFKIDIASEEVTRVVTTAFGLFGLILTIYGRLKANRNLKVGNRFI